MIVDLVSVKLRYVNTLLFPTVAIAALLASVAADRRKTAAALRIAGRRFVAILPLFLTMIAAASFVLAAIPEGVYTGYLGGERPVAGLFAAGLLGSVSVMPGFIAFPLAAMLLSRGVARITLSLFTTTLMMVGVVTLPIEMRYLGRRVAIFRNLFALATAAAVALATGLFFGELF